MSAISSIQNLTLPVPLLPGGNKDTRNLQMKCDHKTLGNWFPPVGLWFGPIYFQFDWLFDWRPSIVQTQNMESAGKKKQLKPEACSVDEFHSHCTPAKTLGDMLVLEKLIDMRMMLSPAGLRSMCSRQVISTVVIYTPCFAEHIIAFACIRIIQRKIRNIPSWTVALKWIWKKWWLQSSSRNKGKNIKKNTTHFALHLCNSQTFNLVQVNSLLFSYIKHFLCLSGTRFISLKVYSSLPHISASVPTPPTLQGPTLADALHDLRTT